MADYKNSIDEHVHYSQSLASVSQIEKLSQKRGKNTVNERFKVTPDTYYPNTYMNRNELRQEMNRKSVTYQDLRRYAPEDIGQLHVEMLQCFGLPTASAFREVSAFGIAVCGSRAFSTDVMPPVGNPMWLCKMQRAGIFPLTSAYQRLFVGIFDHGSAIEKSSLKKDEFIGRVVIDVARLRPGCVYDITLPLRQSAHVFGREPRGSIRLRIHLHWESERAAVASYLPDLDDHQPLKNLLSPNDQHQIHCVDDRAFRNVAQVVHGKDMQGKFSMSVMKATVREFNFLRIHYFRYLRKRELYNLRWWIHPFISGFVFLAWMHAVYANTVRYVPAHFVTFLLLHLYKNYVNYAMHCGHGFLGPSIEELLKALIYGTSDNPKKYIEPLNMERDEQPQESISLERRSTDDSSGELDLFDSDSNMGDAASDGQPMASCAEFSRSIKGNLQCKDESARIIPIRQIAEHMRQALPVRDYKSSMMKTYKDCFMGTAAVNFLLTYGYADSRLDAVALGKRLASETKLFEHITRKYQFEDMPHRYQFLEYDSQTYVITGRKPRGERFFRLIGFLKDEDAQQNRHMEFPFASEKDDPQFTVEESIVIRSLESKKEQEKLKRQRSLRRRLHSSDSFDMDMQSDDDADKLFLGGGEGSSEMLFGGLMASPRSPPQRGLARAAASFRRIKTSSNLKSNPADRLHLGAIEMNPRIKQASTEAATAMKSGLKKAQDYAHNTPFNPNNFNSNSFNSKNFKMFGLSHPGMAYDESSGDVIDVSKRQMGEAFVVEEKVLVKPPPQNVNQKVESKKGTSFAKTVSDARHSMHGVFGHTFNDRVFKVDHCVHSKENDPDDERAVSRKDSSSEKKTPYQVVTDENNKILQIQRYSHSNQMVNRISGVVQPVVEILQIGVFLGRTFFNIYTWQDPIFSFWFAILGPILVVLLYIAPYRIIFGVIGAFFLGPHNWALRVYREQQPGYQPPDLDRIVRKRKLDRCTVDIREKELSACTIFSSAALGGNHQGHIDPKRLRTVVVPTSILKYNHRFYEWPPEAKYARVYQSSADDLVRPTRQYRGGAGKMGTIGEYDEKFEYESVDSSGDGDDSGSSCLLNAESQRLFSAQQVIRMPRGKGRGLINPRQFRLKVVALTDDMKKKRKNKHKIHPSRIPHGGEVRNDHSTKKRGKSMRRMLNFKKNS
ncbi:MAG: hypothetical protein SGBAC_003236 [Bacillariaceae sp.]